MSTSTSIQLMALWFERWLVDHLFSASFRKNKFVVTLHLKISINGNTYSDRRKEV